MCGCIALFENFAFPLRHRFGNSFTFSCGSGGTSASHQALGSGICHNTRQQADCTNRIIVARNRVINNVGIAVGVEDRDNGDVQLARFANGEGFLVGVDDPDCTRNAAHIANTTEGARELLLLTTHHEEFLLGTSTRAGDVIKVHLFEFLEALKPLVNRLEVGEHSTKPALVHERHTNSLGLLFDCLLRLLLCANKQDRSAVRDGLANEFVGAIEERQ